MQNTQTLRPGDVVRVGPPECLEDLAFMHHGKSLFVSVVKDGERFSTLLELPENGVLVEVNATGVTITAK